MDVLTNSDQLEASSNQDADLTTSASCKEDITDTSTTKTQIGPNGSQKFHSWPESNQEQGKVGDRAPMQKKDSGQGDSLSTTQGSTTDETDTKPHSRRCLRSNSSRSSDYGTMKGGSRANSQGSCTGGKQRIGSKGSLKKDDSGRAESVVDDDVMREAGLPREQSEDSVFEGNDPQARTEITDAPQLSLPNLARQDSQGSPSTCNQVKSLYSPTDTGICKNIVSNAQPSACVVDTIVEESLHTGLSLPSHDQLSDISNDKLLSGTEFQHYHESDTFGDPEISDMHSSEFSLHIGVPKEVLNKLTNELLKERLENQKLLKEIRAEYCVQLDCQNKELHALNQLLVSEREKSVQLEKQLQEEREKCLCLENQLTNIHKILDDERKIAEERIEALKDEIVTYEFNNEALEQKVETLKHKLEQSGLPESVNHRSSQPSRSSSNRAWTTRLTDTSQRDDDTEPKQMVGGRGQLVAQHTAVDIPLSDDDDDNDDTGGNDDTQLKQPYAGVNVKHFGNTSVQQPQFGELGVLQTEVQRFVVQGSEAQELGICLTQTQGPRLQLTETQAIGHNCVRDAGVDALQNGADVVAGLAQGLSIRTQNRTAQNNSEMCLGERMVGNGEYTEIRNGVDRRAQDSETNVISIRVTGKSCFNIYENGTQNEWMPQQRENLDCPPENNYNFTVRGRPENDHRIHHPITTQSHLRSQHPISRQNPINQSENIPQNSHLSNNHDEESDTFYEIMDLKH